MVITGNLSLDDAVLSVNTQSLELSSTGVVPKHFRHQLAKADLVIDGNFITVSHRFAAGLTGLDTLRFYCHRWAELATNITMNTCNFDIIGPPGMGKSTLASHLATTIGAHKSVFWIHLDAFSAMDLTVCFINRGNYLSFRCTVQQGALLLQNFDGSMVFLDGYTPKTEALVGRAFRWQFDNAKVRRVILCSSLRYEFAERDLCYAFVTFLFIV